MAVTATEGPSVGLGDGATLLLLEGLPVAVVVAVVVPVVDTAAVREPDLDPVGETEGTAAQLPKVGWHPAPHSSDVVPQKPH